MNNMEMKKDDVLKQNGSPQSHDPRNDSDQEETSGKTKVLIHQDALDEPEHLLRRDGAGERMHAHEHKVLIIPKRDRPNEMTEIDDVITPLSEESSPTATGHGWEEKTHEDPIEQDSNDIFASLFPCCGFLIDPSIMTFGRLFGLIACFLFYVGNLASDAAVCYHLYLHGNMIWFALVAAFTIIPTVILNSISYHLSVYKMLFKRSVWSQGESVVVSVLVALLHLSQFGVFARYLGYIFLHELEYLWVVFCPMKRRKEFKHFSGKYVELPYIPYLFMVEAILQCLPQLIVQLYVLIEGQRLLAPDTQYMLIISITVSLLNLTRLLTLCKHLQKNCTTTWMGLLLIFLWYLFTNISRVLAFSLFATKFILGFLMLCLSHWLIMSAWVVKMEANPISCRNFSGCEKMVKKYLKGLMYGIMYLLCFMKLKITSDSEEPAMLPTRYFHAFFYSVIFLENTVLTFLWFVYSDPVWFHIPALVVVCVSFFLGIGFMMIYYRYYHQNMVTYAKRWQLKCRFPIKRTM